jgi:hypothetical protein
MYNIILVSLSVNDKVGLLAGKHKDMLKLCAPRTYYARGLLYALVWG